MQAIQNLRVAESRSSDRPNLHVTSAVGTDTVWVKWLPPLQSTDFKKTSAMNESDSSSSQWHLDVKQNCKVDKFVLHGFFFNVFSGA